MDDNILKGYAVATYAYKDYYLIKKDEKVVDVYSCNYIKIFSYKVLHNYNTITYNEAKEEFYLTTDDEINSVFVYDKNFEYINKICLNIPKQYVGKINNIFYSKDYRAVVVTTNNHVYLVNLKGVFVKVLYINTEYNCDQSISECTRKLGCYRIKLISAIVCNKRLYIVYFINCFYFIGIVEKKEIKELLCIQNSRVLNLFLKDGYINYLKQLNDCTQTIVETEIVCERNHECGEDCTCDIICSIAMIEKSLARILDAEGCKIQKAIEKAEDIKDLLCINKSVDKLIFNVTFLEHILVEKLGKVLDNDDC